MTTMPKPLLAAVGFDALCHNMEAYISAAASPFTKIFAAEGIRLVASSLKALFEDASDLDKWDELCLASTLGGMAINTAGVTAPHGMEHPASGLRNISHGEGLAALTPVIFEESIAAKPDVFAEVSRLLGGNDERDLVKTLYGLLEAIGLKTTLGALGIAEDDVEWMAANCLKVAAAGMANHPAVFGVEDIKRLYMMAL
jgi:alcohol dehydrogenase class IV